MTVMNWWEQETGMSAVWWPIQNWGLDFAVKPFPSSQKGQELRLMDPPGGLRGIITSMVSTWVSREGPAKRSSLQWLTGHWECSPLCVLIQWTVTEISRQVRHALDRIKDWWECLGFRSQTTNCLLKIIYISLFNFNNLIFPQTIHIGLTREQGSLWEQIYLCSTKAYKTCKSIETSLSVISLRYVCLRPERSILQSKL